ncbi:MAG: ORF6N domain-containing protein [Bacteroidaceae bacterium]|nr:ORF6N domain-containing protein [Bacteroidaceae bacterium]
MNALEQPKNISNMIYTIRGQRVMLDKDLSVLYGVQVRVLNQAVKRNSQRFPEDFMFQLNAEEWAILKSQFVTSSWGGARTRPYAFTEQGVAMLSSVLKSESAIEVNIRIMRAFVAVRQYLTTTRCDNCQLESKVDRLAAYIEEILADQNDINEENRCHIELINEAIAALQTDKNRKPRTIIKGFRSCLDFISSLAERHFGIDLSSRGEANSGLFARIERVKMPEMASDNPKSISIHINVKIQKAS